MGAKLSKRTAILKSKQTNLLILQTSSHLNEPLELNVLFPNSVLPHFTTNIITSVSSAHIFSYFDIFAESFLNLWLLRLHEGLNSICLICIPFQTVTSI